MLKRKTIKVKSNRKNVESRTEDTAVIKKHHIDVSIIIAVRPSQTLCKPPIWCRIEAPHWR